jgi:hypothetical protein
MSVSDITVTEKPHPALKGTTLYVEDPPAKGHRMNTGGSITPTAVYIAPNHDEAKDLNIILWFHGHHVADYQHDLFVKDTAGGKTMLRESVDAAGMDVVLFVPFIGHRESSGDPAFVLPTFDGRGIVAYLANLCGLLQGYLGTTTVGRLVVACHSGSGDIMMQAADGLDNPKGHVKGNLNGKLKECWGYDCMYGNNYKSWMSKHAQQYLYFYQGNGSWASDFRDHWEHAYGTPSRANGTKSNPSKPRLNHVFLAPGTNNPPADMACLTDDEVFQSYDAIKLKKNAIALKKGYAPPLSAYESFRDNLDGLLDTNKGQWDTNVKTSVKEHYELVRDLVGPRIVGLFTGPLSVSTVIAQCKATGVRAAPPPPQKQAPASAGRRK